MQYEVFAALHEESASPWVWLSTPSFPSRTLVRIRHERKSVWCDYRLIDKNFVTVYNERENTRKIQEPASAIVISDWYRSRLGVETGKSVRLEVVACDNWWCELNLYRHHPDRIGRLAASLGILSVLVTITFGILSVIF
jgi:hypothetical protein